MRFVLYSHFQILRTCILDNLPERTTDRSTSSDDPQGTRLGFILDLDHHQSSSFISVSLEDCYFFSPKSLFGSELNVVSRAPMALGSCKLGLIDSESRALATGPTLVNDRLRRVRHQTPKVL